jgi:FixJ family two-component response regulator
MPTTIDPSNHTSSVFVVDDEASVRRALDRLLRSAGHRVETFASASEFLASPAIAGPGCIVLDLQMPEITGIELLESAQIRESSLSAVLVSGHGNIPATVQAMKLGAIDFLTKPFDDTELLQVVDTALARSHARWTERQEISALQARYDSLTHRQREVCALVSRGLLNKQIAYELGTSEKTVKVHRAGVMSKMQAGSVAELVRIVDRLRVHHSSS